MKASILAVGTELTTGQITNRNAAWLAERLGDLGVEVVLHETVADDREMIASALDRCASLGPLVFVTGGLGPTTDDFTREVIARWVGQPLELWEPSWAKITDRLGRLGIPVAESNRQQCYYPRGSKVIVNANGTADAFAVSREATRLWVLPGPPSEVAAVWGNGIQAEVRGLVPEAMPERLLTWQCIGKSEAELGEITERALSGSGLRIGYRAHRPFVEIKVWASDEDIRTKKGFIDALERAIGPWVATRQGEDLAAKLLAELSARGFGDGGAEGAGGAEIEIVDAATGGILAERLGALLREPAYGAQAGNVTMALEWFAPSDPRAWVEGVLDEADPEVVTLAIAGFTPGAGWAVGLRAGDDRRVEAAVSPYRKAELLDRARRHATEIALKRWGEWLSAGTAH